MLDASERQPRIAGHNPVYKDTTSFDALDKSGLLLAIICPDTRSESKRCVVGDFYSFINTIDTKQRRNRAKQFVAIGGSVFRDVRENRRQIVEARRVLRTTASSQHSRSKIDRCLNLFVQVFDYLFSRERTDGNRVIHWITDRQGFHRRDKSLLEFSLNLFID